MAPPTCNLLHWIRSLLRKNIKTFGSRMGSKQRANIKVCFKLGNTFAEIFELMNQIYGDNCLSIHE